MIALLDAIRAHASAKPDAFALSDGAGQDMNWATLAERLDGLAQSYRASFPTDRPVAIALDQGVALSLADMALLEAGIPAVPLPSFFSAEQRAHALSVSGAIGVLDGGVESLASTAFVAGPAVPLPSGTAKISFTSGSTGAPKGICLSRDHMLAVAQGVVDHLGIAHAGRHLALLPPGILLENIAGLYATMLAGGHYVAPSQSLVGLANPFLPDFARMARFIAEQGITSLILVPEYLAGLVAVMEAQSLRLPALTLVAVGGARVNPALLDRAAALGLPVRQGYGLTECASVVCLDDGDPAGQGSVGRSIGVNRLRIAEDGEIVIDGPCRVGILGGETAEGPIHTGDIGRLDADGRLWIEGRKSNLIITSHGRNIAPEWVEGALLAQPGIFQAMVHGDGEAELGALIVPRGAEVDIGAAVAAANLTLPAYARIGRWRMVPPFTPMNGLLTGNGRLRRAAIAAAHLQETNEMPFYDRLVRETAPAQARMIAVPQLLAGLSGKISRATYIAYLTQAFHHVRHTVPLMQEPRSRLADRPFLIEALDEYIEEETGHEAWILNDIAAAGGSAQEAAASPPYPATQAMVDHAYRTIRTGNPTAFFGMVFVLEGTSVAMASQGAAAVARALGLPPQAFTYLNSHGALDQDHLRFFENLMNRIDDADDQRAIIAMANDMFGLFGAMFAAIPMEVDDVAA